MSPQHAFVPKRKYFSYNRYFLLFAIGYVFCFAITRIPYFLNYDIPGIRMAVNYYNDKIFFLMEGKLPVFENLPAMYPLFLYACNLAGLGNNDVLILQCVISMLSVVICQFLVNRYFPAYRWIFFAAALIFYSSALCLNYNTRIEERSLFVDVTILAAAFLATALIEGKKHFFIIASLMLGMMALMRTQGIYVVPVAGIIGFVLLAKRRFAHAAYLVTPLLLLLLASSCYNKATFDSYFFGKYGLVVSIAKVVFYLDDKGEYSEEVQTAIKRVNDSFSEEDKRIVRESWSFRKLREVYNVGNYDDKSGEFKDLFDAHQEELEKLAANSKKKNRIPYFKFICTNFVYCFLINYDEYYFYYNELMNRKYYIERTDAFLFPGFTEHDYQIIYKEYADYIQRKDRLPKTGIIRDEDYVTNFPRENSLVKLNHYYQILFAKIFSNLAWLFILLLAVAASFAAVIRSRFIEPEILLLQIPLLFLIFNYLVVSLSIPPLDGYVYPTKFFVYFYPLSIIFYFLEKKCRTKVVSSQL